MRKLPYILLGMLLVIGALVLIGEAYAGPKQCPPGQRDNCNTFEQKQTGNRGCFPTNANLGEGWFYVHSGCKDKKQDKPTNTVLAPIPTQKPENTQQAPNSDPKEKQSQATIDVSRDVFYVEDLNDCPDDCTCYLVTQAIIQNKILLTQNAIMESNANR